MFAKLANKLAAAAAAAMSMFRKKEETFHDSATPKAIKTFRWGCPSHERRPLDKWLLTKVHKDGTTSNSWQFAPISSSRRTPFHGRRRSLHMAMNIRDGIPAHDGLLRRN